MANVFISRLKEDTRNKAVEINDMKIKLKGKLKKKEKGERKAISLDQGCAG
jgi:hypothetical protein